MKRPSVEEMEIALGIAHTEPIELPSSMQNELDADGDYFRSMYEEELWETYKAFMDNEQK